MTTTAAAILIAGMSIAIAICASASSARDYSIELSNLIYQLSRIADALNKKERREE